MITLIVTQARQAVAVVEEWEGPVPRVGDYMYHPESGEGAGGKLNGAIAGCVLQVIWGIYARPPKDLRHFVKSGAPFAEVVLG
jgi:hypothetical protein